MCIVVPIVETTHHPFLEQNLHQRCDCLFQLQLCNTEWSSLRLLFLSVICGSLARHSCLTCVTIDYCRTIASGIGTKYLENLLADQNGEQLDAIEPAISRFRNGESTTRAD
jgi:hypothetical protein